MTDVQLRQEMDRYRNPSMSYQKGKGYKKMIGYHVGEGGQERPKIWWLGHDEAFAKEMARRIMAFYDQWQADGAMGNVWAPEAIEIMRGHLEVMKAEREREIADARRLLAGAGAVPTLPAARAAVEKPAGKTLYDAIAAYLESFRGKRRAVNHKQRAAQTLEANLQRTKGSDGKPLAPNVPMNEIDYVWLDRLCDKIKARPKSLKTGKPISAQTVKTILQYVRQFFIWCDDTGYGGWEGPRKLMKPFRVRLDELRTAMEKDAAEDGVEHLTMEEIKRLYHAGTDWQRTLLLLGIFTGQGQKELSVTRRAEFDLDSATFRHRRNKTGIGATYWLPPELVDLLRRQLRLTPKNERGLAFLNAEGKPLIVEDEVQGRVVSDAVRQAFVAMKEAAGITRPFGYYICRKFLAKWAKDNGGIELAQTALAQSSGTILEKHYDRQRRNFAPLHAIQRKLHEELTAAGVFNVKPAKGDQQAA